jgi:hypothetical protein
MRTGPADDLEPGGVRWPDPVRLDVLAALEFIFAHFDVVRAYCDPPGWETQVSYLQGKYGEKHVIEWPTYRPCRCTRRSSGSGGTSRTRLVAADA